MLQQLKQCSSYNNRFLLISSCLLSEFGHEAASRQSLHGRGLAVPLGGLKDGSALLLEAAADGGVADRQVVGAAVDLVVAADGVVQRAASPREAVAEELPLAAACAS